MPVQVRYYCRPDTPLSLNRINRISIYEKCRFNQMEWHGNTTAMEHPFWFKKKYPGLRGVHCGRLDTSLSEVTLGDTGIPP